MFLLRQTWLEKKLRIYCQIIRIKGACLTQGSRPCICISIKIELVLVAGLAGEQAPRYEREMTGGLTCSDSYLSGPDSGPSIGPHQQLQDLHDAEEQQDMWEESQWGTGIDSVAETRCFIPGQRVIVMTIYKQSSVGKRVYCRTYCDTLLKWKLLVLWKVSYVKCYFCWGHTGERMSC